VWDSEGRIGYEPLKPAYGGILFSDLSLKGVYFIDAETYEVKQVIDEVTEYKFENAEFVKLHPAIDAKDYTLYTTSLAIPHKIIYRNRTHIQLFAIFFRKDTNCLSVITIRKRTMSKKCIL